MKRLILIVLIATPGQAYHDRVALENIRTISAASRYPIYEITTTHKTRRIKHEKISTLQMELSAEMARQAHRAVQILP